jgi:hypothetical protein
MLGFVRFEEGHSETCPWRNASTAMPPQERERAAAVLARWVITTHPAELHVRHLQREVRLPGLRTVEQIRAAAGVLVEADWLRDPAPGTAFGQRGRIAYAVNPRLWKAAE